MRFDPGQNGEWARVIEEDLQISLDQGKDLHATRRFPNDILLEWFRTELVDGFSAEFVPALERNINGLVDWVYGTGAEPFWPGSDDQATGEGA